MIKILFLGVTSVVCGTCIYFDFINRQNFNEIIESDQSINGDNFIEGIITFDKSQNNDVIMNDIFTNNQLLVQNPFTVFESYIKNIQFRHDYNFYHKNKNYYYYVSDKFYENWVLDQTIRVDKPHILINNCKINYDDNLKIFYPASEYVYVSNNKYLIKKYIPDNSRTTIFGNFSDNVFNVKYIGKKSEIIDNVACKYFGISTEYTLLLYTTFLISTWCLLNKYLMFNFCCKTNFTHF
ncbi:hypothetical protein QLL95_gp0965 [Cotonvirus japonicus]|uniref:Uncharacterized protein n=1 Tax=Cotonvirus japonicus TaxID=2811091 RepID=A0ABM7NSL2_9VIRU|nr:hypothetical protein QLL95_gp0965 [Cotonvirus japonicus]BCS83158.1 hypothetical protein [Cotonvirus japonicus]